jgi:hypothetical protein
VSKISLGYDREGKRYNQGDTAELYATLYGADGEALPEADILTVEFVIQRPDGIEITEQGAITADGTGFYRYADADLVGKYNVLARFTMADGEIRSTSMGFEVVDPFDPTPPDATESIADKVWLMFEDCFDSEEGGPWLRDMTLRYFNRSKIPKFIDEGVFIINQQPPGTDLILGNFYNPDLGELNADAFILVEATFLACVRHLMRSYVEQPAIQGAQVVYEDRRDYLQRWQMLYQMEWQEFIRNLTLWKRKFLSLGETALLVGSKAGRLVPAPMRTRQIGRGYY